MQGTIRRNGVLEPMSPYSCINKPRLETVSHSQDATVTWPDVFMRGPCPYDKKATDERCAGCLK